MKRKIMTGIQWVLMGVLLFSGVQIYQYQQNIQQTEAIESASRQMIGKVQEEMELVDSDNVEDAQAISKEFVQSLKEHYPEAVGYIEIDDSRISYPIVQHEDSQYYLTHAPDQSENANGSIFLDHRNEVSFTDDNTIIYGHYIRSGKLFHDLYQFREQSFVDKVPTFELQTLEGPKTYQVFSVYDTDPDFTYRTVNYADNEEKVSFLQTIQEKSLVQADTTFDEETRIVTLSTCSNKGATRLVVHGVELQDDEHLEQ